jgi:hypothetical protein
VVHRSDRLRGGLGYAHRRHVAVERGPRRGEFADPDGRPIALLAGAGAALGVALVAAWFAP